MQVHVYMHVKAKGQVQILASETPSTSIEDKLSHWHETLSNEAGLAGHKDPVSAFPAQD